MNSMCIRLHRRRCADACCALATHQPLLVPHLVVKDVHMCAACHFLEQFPVLIVIFCVYLLAIVKVLSGKLCGMLEKFKRGFIKLEVNTSAIMDGCVEKHLFPSMTGSISVLPCAHEQSMALSIWNNVLQLHSEAARHGSKYLLRNI